MKNCSKNVGETDTDVSMRVENIKIALVTPCCLSWRYPFLKNQSINQKLYSFNNNTDNWQLTIHRKQFILPNSVQLSAFYWFPTTVLSICNYFIYQKQNWENGAVHF